MYKDKKELNENSIILTMSTDDKNADKACEWLKQGRSVYCIGRNKNGIVINFHPKDKTDGDKWKQAFLKYASHNVGCMISHEHNNTPCSCGYSKLALELMSDEDWTNWVLAKQPY